MGLFKRSQQWPINAVAGPRGSVLVTGIGYKLEDLPRAFGQLPELAESEFVATLRPMPANEWNRTPVEVWVNGVHIGYINDRDSKRYWDAMQKSKAMISCSCLVKTTALPVAGQGFQVGKVKLSLPASL